MVKMNHFKFLELKVFVSDYENLMSVDNTFINKTLLE